MLPFCAFACVSRHPLYLRSRQEHLCLKVILNHLLKPIILGVVSTPQAISMYQEKANWQ